ncbi:MAG: RusA family crossover junction endodeoxyribonuclease [Methanomicrobia archaeon]|nr:RusA family crossover junction endodeoxyribonuclease [Methanomicrobia archaeon]
MEKAVQSQVVDGCVGSVIEFVIEGNPVPKGRPKAARVGKRAILYTPKKTREYEAHVASVAKDYAPDGGLLTGPLRVFLSFYLKKSKGLSKRIVHHVKRGDIDNYVKSILDALEGVIYKNDSQVVELHATKSYGEPRVEVKVVEL